MLSLGIDFGTSTTVAAISRTGWAEVVEIADGDQVMPSCVSFLPNGGVAVGKKAIRRRLMDARNTLYSVKRIIGKPWHAAEVAEYRRQYPFELEKGDDNLPRFPTRVGNITAGEAATLIVSRLQEAPSVQDAQIETVTVSVPVVFDEAQRQAIVEAVSRAGFDGVTTVDEPCAAGLAYRRQHGGDDLVFVYDLGGGTFDAAVLKWSGDSYEVLGVAGDAYLGGDDVDLRLASWAAQRVLEEHRWDIKSNPVSFQGLVFDCESAKVELSALDSYALDLTPIDEVLRGKSITVTRPQIDELCTDLVRRTFVVCDETLRQAGVRPENIHSVVTSGGGCHMPIVLDGVRGYFGRNPWHILAPDRVVAIGASFQADGVDW